MNTQRDGSICVTSYGRGINIRPDEIACIVSAVALAYDTRYTELLED